MQRVASVTRPESLTALLAHALEEGTMNEQNENRLFAEVREIDHMLRGNGGKGILSRLMLVEDEQRRQAEERKERQAEIAEEKRQALVAQEARETKRKNGFWYRLTFQAASVGVALVLGAVFTTYVNRTPSPVEKKLTVTEEQDRKRAEERLERIEEKLTKIVSPPPQPAPPRPQRSRRPPRGRAELRGGEMIAPSRSPTV